MQVFKLYVFLLFFLSYTIHSDPNKSIQGFYGEKAIGLSGAYTALSDDPSGLYYNPAGIAFAINDSISVNASSYQVFRKTYENVFGPGQSYTRESKNFLPNFIGVIKTFDKINVGFSVVNVLSMKYYLSGENNLPLYEPNVLSYKADATENSQAFLIGPGLGYKLSSKISLGLSLFYSYDFEDLLLTATIDKKDGSVTKNSIKTKRTTTGILPILGMQIQASNKLSIGFSIRRNVTYRHERFMNSNTLNAEANGSTFTRNKEFIEVSDRTAVAFDEPVMIYFPNPKVGKVPELTEGRLGMAYFYSPRFLFSTDIIYTSSYWHAKRTLGYTTPLNAFVSADNTSMNNINRQSTLNFALGMEFFLTETFAIRLGTYTNYSNAERHSNLQMQISRFYSNPYSPLPLPVTDKFYYIPTSERTEFIDNFGYSIGFAFESTRSVISLSFIIEKGRGRGFAFNSMIPQTIKELNLSAYFSAGTNY
ncbi:MAG: hypothetical protein H7A25_15910 [Leptospiraceae bacterium]|nr:hypothetical protein [Leptospiraceae bacterium]MCP5501387.1 hypothetical protein [Leptospiraceae bacterium]